jgi:hypothetical protein
MGYNTAIMVLNDTLWNIEKDPEFGKKLAEDIACPDPSFCTSGAKVLASCHSSFAHLVLIGGNTGVDLGYIGDCNMISKDIPAVKEAVLRAFAERLGFTVRKNPPRKQKA